MISVTRILLALVLVLGVGLFVRFGTVSPCGMLKNELKTYAMRDALARSSTPGHLIGMGLSATLVDATLDGMVSALSPLQCTKVFWRLLLEGDRMFTRLLPSALPHATSAKMGDSTPLPPAKPTWRVSTEKSPLDDSTNVFLSIDADTPITDWTKERVTPSLHLRCQEHKTQAYIHVGTSLETTQWETARLTLRFDSEKASQENFPLATSYDAVFFPAHIPTIKKMLRHERLLIEITPFRAAPQRTTFRLTGLSEHVVALRKACQW